MSNLNLNCSMGNGVKGSYNNLLLKTTCYKNNLGWKHTPCNAKLKSQYLYVPQGHPIPLNPTLSKVADSMFIFSRNYSHPDCCPSTYSTDLGCICTTPEQIRYIAAMRGGNNTGPTQSI